MTESGTAQQIISLPKGGGALKGIGETFAPDLHTGTGNLTVPIAMLPGRNEFEPGLTLGYSTGAGNGPFGLGWGLSVPGVTRKTSHGLPTYDDERDTFVLSGAEDLVPTTAAATVTTYQPRTEGLFARIEHHRGDDGNFWRVWTGDGRISVYGTPRPRDAAADWRDPAVLADPRDARRIFAWKLSLTTDSFGNRIAYEYFQDDSAQPARTQTYLSRVRYVDNGNGDFLAEVRFEYEERPDAFSDRRPTFDVHTRLRCTRIAVHSAAIPAGPVRTQLLSYDDTAPNGLSLLTRMVVEGRDGDRTETLPPLVLGYTPFEPEGREFAVVTGPELPERSLADPGLELVDLTGDGLPDLLETTGGMRWWRNLGSGRFDRPRTMRHAPAVGLADPGVRLLDADGDGRVDLLANDGFYSVNPDGEWDTRLFRRYEVAPSFPADDPEVRLVDLDGDGVTDAIRSGARFECFFNDPQRGWHETRTVERGRYPDFPDVSFADPRVRLADMTGDGLQDIVLVHNGRTEVWPSLARGDWAGLRVMRDSPRFPEGYDPRRVLVGDVDGDGAADVLYVDDDSVTLWINRSGQGFSAPITVKGTPRVTDMSAVRLVDLLGTGVAGILWSSDTHPLFFLDLTGGTKPGLLTETDDSTGAVTRISYASSTEFRAEGTSLPFPVRVVSTVEILDRISGGRLTTTYRYAHGHWDGAEREFRGFGRVDQRDTERLATGASAPLETRSWFHLGPVGPEFGDWTEPDPSPEFWSGDLPALTRPTAVTALLDGLPRRDRRDAIRALRGQKLRTELYQLDGSDRAGRPVTVTEFLPGLRAETASGRRVFFPHLLATRTTQWERGYDPMTRLDFSADHDPYGRPRTQLAIAVPRGRDFRSADGGEPCLVSRSVTEYANRDDEQRYLTGRMTRSVAEELLDPGRVGVLELPSADLPTRVTAETRSYYDGEPFEGLPLGRLGDHGVASRSETLVLTEEIVAAAYGGAAPPYLAAGRERPAWTADYPVEFRELLTPLAGHVVHDGGWWSVTGTQVDDRGLTVATRDPVGALTSIEYDEHGRPTSVTDPAGLRTTAAYDNRTFAVSQATDPNGNRSAFGYTPLGLLERTAALGKVGEIVGDTLQQPTSQQTYDLHAFVDRGQPISVRAVRRVHHVHDTDVPVDDRDATIESVEFSDGFGRLLQTRTQAEDIAFGDPTFGESDVDRPGDVVGIERPDRVVVSGWQTYDDKGRVVEKYQPLFGTGYDYAPPGEADLGRKVTTTYDARGRVVRTTHPDGSQERVVHGVPADLADPDRFVPTVWEAFSYDANDNAGRTHPDTATDYRGHWDTPTSVLVDPLGRTVEAVARTGTEEHRTGSAYDIQGRLLTLTDELDRVAYRHEYDLAGRVLRTEQLDSGVSTAVFDAAGRPAESRDAKGSVILHGHDAATRPIRVWGRDLAGEPVSLRQRLAYGTDPAANLAGRVIRHHDEAGLVTVERCDFTGNVLETVRQVVSDEQALSSPVTDWAFTGTVLDPTEYRTSSRYDAIGRVRVAHYPADVTGHRAHLVPRYNRAGALESVRLDDATYVEHIGYDARGRRTLIAHGNGVLTRYGYDPDTFRLTRLRTSRFTTSGPLAFRPTGPPVQDLTYTYDLVGNLLTLLDRTPGSGVPTQPDRLLRRFTYDPRYRLLSASGREHDLPQPLPWAQVFGTDVTRTRGYTEHYTYDPAGNLTELRHSDRATRAYGLAPGTNRLAALSVGQTTFAYSYDAGGNLVREMDSRRLEWDAADQLRAFRVQAGSEASVTARYRYDAAGQRVRKVVRKQSGEIESTVYIGGTFEHHRHVAGTDRRESSTLHVMDGAQRIALVRVGPPDPDDATPPVKYQLADHLGSAVVTLDGAGAPVSSEEYTPYGETSFGGHARKRYRFTGKERDEESSLSYHGARYYAPWLARWTSPDPAGPVDGPNLYQYARDNPMVLVDPTGRQSAAPDQKQATGTNSAGAVPPGLPPQTWLPPAVGPREQTIGPSRPMSTGPLPPSAYMTQAEKGTMRWQGGKTFVGSIALFVGSLHDVDEDALTASVVLGGAADGMAGLVAGMLFMGGKGKPSVPAPEPQTNEQAFLPQHLHPKPVRADDKRKPDPMISRIITDIERWYPGLAVDHNVTKTVDKQVKGEIDVMLKHMMIEVKTGSLDGATKKMSKKQGEFPGRHLLFAPDLHQKSTVIRGIRALGVETVTGPPPARGQRQSTGFRRDLAEVNLMLAINPFKSRLTFSGF